MNTIVLDTYRLVNLLKGRGFTEDQARGVTEAIQEIDLSGLATKADLLSETKGIKADLKELELRMTIKLGGMIIAGVAFLAAVRFFG